jgi:hypothetical protein
MTKQWNGESFAGSARWLPITTRGCLVVLMSLVPFQIVLPIERLTMKTDMGSESAVFC